MTPDPRYAEDHRLAHQAAAGSEPHWHAIVQRFTPLIRATIRRYLRDDDDIGAVWTAVLERLRGGLLDQFQGQSSLATWLVLVARSAACDHVRRVRGRRRLPERLEGGDLLLVATYTELMLQGRGPVEATHRLRERGLLPADRSLAEVVVELEDLLGDVTLSRVAFDLQADRAGAATNPYLESLDDSVDAANLAHDGWSDEQALHAIETRRTLGRLHDIVAALPEDERQVIELRFGRGWPADRVARALDLGDRREVYTISERALRAIRRLLGAGFGSLLVVLFFRGPS